MPVLGDLCAYVPCLFSPNNLPVSEPLDPNKDVNGIPFVRTYTWLKRATGATSLT